MATYISYANLSGSAQLFYDEYDFLDYYALTNRLDASTVRELSRMEGILAIEPRITKEARIEIGDAKVAVKLNSLPPGRAPSVNKLFFEEGNPPQEGKNQCLVSSSLKNFYNLSLGDEIRLIAQGKVTTMQVSGVVISPEYIYEVSGGNQVFTLPGEYGILYLNEAFLQSLYGYASSYNEVHFRLQKANRAVIIERIEDALTSSGFIAGVERKDQLSYTLLSSEIDGLQSMAIMFPVLFLGISLFMLYVMLKRTIEGQRIVLGTMKALGITKREIVGYYLKLGGLTGLTGSLLGAWVGNVAGVALNEYYTLYFHIPVMLVESKPYLVILAVFMGVSISLVAAYLAGRRIIALRPAVAMRPSAPEAMTGFDYNRLGFVWKKIPFGWKMVIRNMGRKKMRTLATALGVSFTLIMLLVSLFLNDTTEVLLKKNYQDYQTFDLKASFIAPASHVDVARLASIEGVQKVEPTLDMAVKLKFRGREKDIMLSGVVVDTSMVHLEDEQFRAVLIPPEGIVLTASHARDMGIQVGDTVLLEPYDQRLPKRETFVAALSEQFMDFVTYGNIDYLGRLFDDSSYATGVAMTADPEQYAFIEDTLQDYAYVQSVINRADMVDYIVDMTGFMYVFMGVMLTISGIMGFAIIFNGTIINMAERKRELASLRVLGYRLKEVKRLLARENMLVALLAVLPGIYAGYRLSVWFGEYYSNDIYNLIVTIKARSYLLTIGVTLFFVWLASVAVQSRIRRLDMVEVLKDREG